MLELDANSETALLQLGELELHAGNYEKAAEYLKDNGETDYRKRAIERQIGRTLVPENCVTVFEFKRVYRYQFEKRQPT